jgi:hypothetical protein
MLPRECEEGGKTMNPKQMILRCYGEQKGNVWQAFCLDLNLAVQGDSFPEVRRKLHQQIASYLYDALEGEDQKYADQLLSRKAPIGFWAKYYYYKMLCSIHNAKNGICHIFNEIMPLTPHRA